MDAEDLTKAMIAKGWVHNPDGSWSRPKKTNAKATNTETHSGLPGGVQNPERKPVKVSSLVKSPPVRPSRKSCVVVLVTIIAFRRRVLDDDNCSSGAKTLRDCVATSLGVDDGDKRIRWEYGIVQTNGPEHTLVKITLL